LDNFRDFSSWNREDIHEFSLDSRNDIFGESLKALDQLAVETDQDVTTNHSDDLQIPTTAGTDHGYVRPINTKDPVHTIKTGNNDPGVADETIQPSSGNKETLQGIYDDKFEQGASDSVSARDNLDINKEKEKQNEALLKRIQMQYEEDPSIISTYFNTKKEDQELPLISISKTDPFSVTLAVKPFTYDVYTMVRLMYERVPVSKQALLQNLDDPVIEYVPMYRGEEEHRLYNLPVGKYIICGEAFTKGSVFQGNCLEAHVEKNSTKQLQGGVVCLIALALLTVTVVVVYAVYHRLVIYKLEKES